ncbi:MAG: type IV toxin-antitoxin system AbiEi family antitoxin domain-containing protein [Pseudomonadota bacterium]
MPLMDAAQIMMGELREAAQWEAELLNNLAETRARKGELLGALDRLGRAIQGAERTRLRAEIARIQLPLMRARRKSSYTEEKAQAVLTFLATTGGTFTTAELQAYLAVEGVMTHKNDAASFLHRRVKEGMAERLRRGIYRTVDSHPDIANRRMKLVGL